MADEVTTRMQKKVAQLQKDMEKMADKTKQLPMEFHVSIEAMRVEMMSMFEKLMRSQDYSVEESGGSRGVFYFEERLKFVMVTETKPSLLLLQSTLI